MPEKLLDCANDWSIQVDFADKESPFPVEIFPTNLRPDVVVWSTMAGEEENFRDAQLRKETKYADLVSEIQQTKVWKVYSFTVEVLNAQSPDENRALIFKCQRSLQNAVLGCSSVFLCNLQGSQEPGLV
jgi:hypothetical protein